MIPVLTSLVVVLAEPHRLIVCDVDRNDCGGVARSTLSFVERDELGVVSHDRAVCRPNLLLDLWQGVVVEQAREVVRSRSRDARRVSPPR